MSSGVIGNAGAVTWANGTTVISGVVSATNSLVGSTTSDNVGRNIVALTNGNYVVISDNWNNGAVTYAGAVTWASGTTGITGPVSTSNSLVGTKTGDYVNVTDVIIKFAQD